MCLASKQWGKLVSGGGNSQTTTWRWCLHSQYLLWHWKLDPVCGWPYWIATVTEKASPRFALVERKSWANLLVRLLAWSLKSHTVSTKSRWDLALQVWHYSYYWEAAALLDRSSSRWCTCLDSQSWLPSKQAEGNTRLSCNLLCLSALLIACINF